MRRFWITYGIVGALLLAYTGLGWVASYTPRVPIRLAVGETAQISVFRLNEGRVKPTAHLLGQRHGPDKQRFDEKETAKFDIELSVGETPSVRYSLGETSGWGSVAYMRDLAAPDGRSPTFHLGINQLRLKIAAVDPSLAGERIEIWVEPALGFKSTESSVEWLWPTFLSFVYLPILALIGLLGVIVWIVSMLKSRGLRPEA